jgi:glycosyltransferase involved in cell wall biosynthesis
MSMPKIRAWDQATHSRVDAFAANSKFVAGRVKRYYGREADVVNPPVDTDFYKPSDSPKKDYYLVISALEPYKRIDLAIDAFNKNKMKLKIVGGGSKFKELRRRASDNIEFLGRINDYEIKTLYQNAKAFIFPGIEDFGITPVEAQACGTPVIAFGRGGATETVIHKKTGVLFNEQTVDGLNGAIDILIKIDFNKKTLRENSVRFSKGSFHKNFIAFLKKNLSY